MKDGSVLEVTTVFEDTVIAVDTFSRPRRKAWPFLCAGALGLLLAGLAFARGVEVAAANERAAAAWLGPAVAFRPQRLAAGWEVLIAVGLAGGLGSIVIRPVPGRHSARAVLAQRFTSATSSPARRVSTPT